MELRRLAILVLLGLPFTKSLTLDVAFSLKLYELLLPLALLAAASERALSMGPDPRFARGWVLFWLWSLVPTAWGYTLVTQRDLTGLEWATGRFDPLVNVLFHTAYLALDIVALVVFLSAFASGALGVRGFCVWWSRAALVAVAYALYLNLLQLAGLPMALALRSAELQTIEVAGFSVVRNGPFEEGNFFGLYLVCSLALVLWALPRWPDRELRWAVGAIGVGLVVCASPAALFFGLLLLGAALLRPGMPALWRGAAGVAAAGLVVAVAATDLLQRLVLDKFSLLIYGGITDSANVSLAQRLNESHHAWEIARDHPLGVGIGNFAFFWGDHPELYPWLVLPYQQEKLIPNNVYLEVLSEQGWPGLLLFVGLMALLLLPLWRRREGMLALGTVCMLGYFLVFPTFRLAFLWVFWAFLVQVGSRERGPA